MTNQLRFRDLKARNIVNNWPQLRKLQEKHGFPIGRLLSPNIRVWDEEDEVAPWLASRPAQNTRPLQGRPKALLERAKAKRRTQVNAAI
jgi:hypothetical protein